MARIFIYDGKDLPDPDPSMSVEEVRQSYTEFFPELANAESTTGKRGDDETITFKKRVGTKGAEVSVKVNIPDGMNCWPSPNSYCCPFMDYGEDGYICHFLEMELKSSWEEGKETEKEEVIKFPGCPNPALVEVKG